MIFHNFKEIDLVPMSHTEMEETEGGFWPILWPIIGGAVLAGIIADWDDFKAGLSGGCSKKKYLMLKL